MTITPSITAYHGRIVDESFHGVECYKLIPQGSGHLRVHTKRVYHAPLITSFWMYPTVDMRPRGTTGNKNLDGLHVHFGHIDNHTNYNVHIVRRDSHAKIDIEHGLRGYSRVKWFNSGGIPVRLWRRYLFTLLWELDHVKIQVSNDHDPIEMSTLEAPLPEYGPKAGHIGFRLDNLQVLMGGFAIREQ